MHEFSVVRSLLNQVEQIADRQGACRVSQVKLSVGEFSGVDAELLELAFDQLAPERLSSGVRLVVQRVPLQARCNRCDQTFAIESFRFVCPACCETSVTVTAGEELLLESVTMETNR